MALGQYLDLFKVLNRMQVYERNMELTARLIADIQAKHEQGMALRNDVTRYELQMEQLRLGLRQLKDQQAVLNHQLCNTLGLQETPSLLPQLGEASDWWGAPLGLHHHATVLFG